MLQGLQMQKVVEMRKFLGLPYLIGKSKQEIFSHIKERVIKKTHGWKERFLLNATKEVLMKSVLQAIPTYAMSLFLLP